MKRNWMAFCLAAALMTAGTVYAKPAPSQLVPEKHGQCYVEDNLFVKELAADKACSMVILLSAGNRP